MHLFQFLVVLVLPFQEWLRTRRGSRQERRMVMPMDCFIYSFSAFFVCSKQCSVCVCVWGENKYKNKYIGLAKKYV